MATLVHKKRRKIIIYHFLKKPVQHKTGKTLLLSVLVVELHPEEVLCVALVDIVDYVLVV